MNIRVFSLAAALMLAAVVSFAAAEGEYRLDTGDTIGITVWGHDDLSLQSTVRPDGRISLPLLGELTVRGATIDEVRVTLERGLAAYVREPRVTVALLARRQISIKVFGQVNRPGAYTVNPDASIAELIAMAGGPTRRAALERVQLLRGGDPNQSQVHPQGRRDRFGAGEAVRGPQLADGDVIFVPETTALDWERIFAFLGGLLTVKELLK